MFPEPTMFPPADEIHRKGGWIIDYAYLKHIESLLENTFPDLNLEDIEGVLLAVMDLERSRQQHLTSASPSGVPAATK